MSKSEDIRLQINKVRHKKSDGTLYLMAERLAWMPNNEKNLFTISQKYSDIKMQKISPEGKAKIQLQVVLHNGDTTTYQFENIEDRTAVKDALLQILPQFKGKVPKERERKALLLSKNPCLLQLYKDLVETKIISSEEFWTQFIDEKSDLKEELHDELQEVGVSADFMAGIPLNGKQIKGSVTVETLWAILKTYPKVAEKHKELVPSKMTESEFWNKFFQSRYFHRDRTRDIFTDCAKTDEKEWSANLKKSVADPFLNLDMFDDNAYNATADQTIPPSSSENPNSTLMKRFNQYSIRLLETLKRSQNSSSSATDPSLASSSQSNVNNSGGVQSQNNDAQQAANNAQQQMSFKANRRDLTFDDLAGHDLRGDYLMDQRESVTREIQVDKDRYSIVPQTQHQAISQESVRAHMEAFACWQPNLENSITSMDAVDALKDLSPGGALMQSTNINRLHDTVPEELKEKLRSLYFGSNELLRHFWLCFPVVEPRLEQKLVKIYETLKKFESTQLQPFHDSLPRDQRHLANHIMRSEFKEAQCKFDNWKSKLLPQKSKADKKVV